MTNVVILNVIAKKSLISHRINICSKVVHKKNKLQKIFTGTEKAWDSFNKAGVKRRHH